MELFLTQNGGLIGAIIVVVACVNIALTALSAILDKVQDSTATDADNKANAYIKKALSVLKTVLDWVTANRAH